MKPLPEVLGKQKKYLMDLLEVVTEIARRNVESANKFFLAVDEKVLQGKELRKEPFNLQTWREK